MKLSSRFQSFVLIAFPLLLGALAFWSPLIGQESKGKDKAKGKLPPYYNQVVSDAQKAKIYDIQAKYKKEAEPIKEQMDKLLAEMKKINEREKAEIDALLSKEQLEKLEKISTEAKAKQKKGPEATKDGDGKDSEKKAE